MTDLVAAFAKYYELAKDQERKSSEQLKKKKKPKSKTVNSTELPQESKEKEEKELVLIRPPTPTWPPERRYSGSPTALAAAHSRYPRPVSASASPTARAAQKHSPPQEEPQQPSILMSRPSRPQTAPASRSTGGGYQAPPWKPPPDEWEGKPKHVDWDTEAPLPSVMSNAGRKEFLETPAYVIAAHYERDPPLSALARSQQLHAALHDANQRIHKAVRDKVAMEEELGRKRSELFNTREQNEELRSKCAQLSAQVLAAQRSAREMRESRDMLADQLQAFKLSSSGTKLREMQAHLIEANAEIERLRDIIAQRDLRA